MEGREWRGGRRGQGRAGEWAGRERRREGRGRGREGNENGDRPPTIFGLKIALLSLGCSC